MRRKDIFPVFLGLVLGAVILTVTGGILAGVVMVAEWMAGR